jgi:hypothetical protein
MMATQPDFSYKAFISYSHRDEKWAAWLHRALETFRAPNGLRRPDGSPLSRIYPVFRDRDELPTSASLAHNIEEALRNSRMLIVVCSPQAATSHWVDEEIRRFKLLGREDDVLAVIVGGEPNASDKGDPAAECFPPSLRFRVLESGRLTEERVEPIAADLRPGGDGRRNALLKIAAPLLGVSFDSLRQRDRRRRRQRLMVSIGLSAAAVTVIASSMWRAVLSQGDADRSQRLEQQAHDFLEASRMIDVNTARTALPLAARAVLAVPGHASSRALALRLIWLVGRGESKPLWQIGASPRFAKDRLMPELPPDSEFVLAARITENGRTVVTVSQLGMVQRWDAITGARKGTAIRLERPAGSAFGRMGETNDHPVEISEDGRWVSASVSANTSPSSEAEYTLWDSETGKRRYRLGNGTRGQFSADGRSIVTATPFNLHLWNTSSGTVVKEISAGYVVSFSLSPHADLLAVGSSDSTARVLDTTGALRSGPFSHEDKYITHVAFSPDGATVGTVDGTAAHFWDTKTGKTKGVTLRIPDNTIESLAFSSDGQRVATAGYMVTVWDVKTGAPLVPALRPGGWGGARDVAFSDDGQRLLTTNRGGNATLWDVATASEQEASCVALLAEVVAGVRLPSPVDGTKAAPDIVPAAARAVLNQEFKNEAAAPGPAGPGSFLEFLRRYFATTESVSADSTTRPLHMKCDHRL